MVDLTRYDPPIDRVDKNKASAYYQERLNGLSLSELALEALERVASADDSASTFDHQRTRLARAALLKRIDDLYREFEKLKAVLISEL